MFNISIKIKELVRFLLLLLFFLLKYFICHRSFCCCFNYNIVVSSVYTLTNILIYHINKEKTKKQNTSST